MKKIEYEYSTAFGFPFAVEELGDEERTYDVDSITSFRVQNNDKESGKARDCTFRLSAKCSVDARSLEDYNPTNYEQYAWDLKQFYNTARLGIVYLTGIIIKSQANLNTGSRISDFSNPPEITHDFYERAADAGERILVRKGRMDFSMGCCLGHAFTEAKLIQLQRIAEAVRADHTGGKLEVLDLYFRGFIDSVYPYFHWHQVLEMARNHRLSFLTSFPDKITVSTGEINVKFLRYFAHIHRHYADNPGAVKARQELASDADLAQYLNAPQAGRKFYEDNLRILIDHFILNC